LKNCGKKFTILFRILPALYFVIELTCVTSAQQYGEVIESTLFHDIVKPGSQNSHEILIERARQVDISCTWGGEDLEIKLVDPSGNKIDSSGNKIDSATRIPDYKINYEFSAEPEAEDEGRYILEGNYPAGIWKVQLSTSDTSSYDKYYMIAVYFVDTELKMNSYIDKISPKTDETITINTSLKRNSVPVKNASVLAMISLERNFIDSLRLYDDGIHHDSLADDGIYSSQFEILKQGDYHARIVANKPGDEPFSRSDEYDVSFIVNNSTIDGLVGERTIDEDGDGLYDKLVLDIGLNITLPHMYFLKAHLYDKNNKQIIRYARTHTVLSPGYQTMEFPFDGVAIFESGINGPYFVKTLIFTDSSGYIPALDSIEEFHTIKEYDFRDFEHGPIYFNGKHKIEELDIDGNGLIDSLIIYMEVELEQDAHYKWYADIRCEEDGLGVRAVDIESDQDAGIAYIRFSFNGERMRWTRCRGKFAVVALGWSPKLMIRSFNPPKDRPIFWTREYKYTDFELPPRKK
jgi:hypothetical protein